ncbi:MAG: efflux RND transporter periplasmic adaptor subunit [Moraxellaceae bacterium]|nr:efflux RND transporter periplasmic adaptor subunit [Moraxellaceae bacterium]
MRGLPAGLALFAGLCLNAVAAPALTSRPLSAIADYPASSVTATVVADNESRLAAEVSARIEALPVRTGERVAKGAVLARLDARSAEVELARARAQVDILQNRLALAELQLEQANALKERQYVSAELLKQRQTEAAVMRAEVGAAQQAVKQAELTRERTVIKAPFAGTVKERLASVGELAAPGTVLLVLTEQGRNEVRALVPEMQMASLRGAKTLGLRMADRQVPLTIARISGVIERRDQTREVVLTAKEPLPNGYTSELVWVSPLPFLPASYVQQRGREFGAWLLVDGKPVFRVLPGAQAGRPVAVNWPLDTLLVEQGRFSLNPVAPATPAPAAKK